MVELQPVFIVSKIYKIMVSYYIIGLCAIVGLLFVAALWLIIHGYKKYDFNPIAFAVPFVGAILSFPIYFALKERFLKKNNGLEEDVKLSRRLMILGFVFVGAIILVFIFTGVWFFVEKMNGIEAGVDIEAVLWAKRQFWGVLAVCVAYAASLAGLGCCSKK